MDYFMRMWNVNPKILCRKHLLGEHLEMHMFAGSIKKGISLNGFINNGCVEIHNIKKRHDELATELSGRMYNHKTPIKESIDDVIGYVDTEQNINELMNRCPECKERIIEWKKENQ